MDLTPKTLREVVFREKLRGGYHPDDVDEFLEQVANGVEELHERLRQALERAQRAETGAPKTDSGGGGGAEEAVRTLVLAQRTADMAVHEAREQAAKILASAEVKAQSVAAAAEERSRRHEEATLSGARDELSKLESARAQAQQEAEALHRWIEEHKAHLRSTLRDALSVVDRSGVKSPPPASHPVEGLRKEPVEPAAPARPEAKDTNEAKDEAAPAGPQNPAADGAPTNGPRAPSEAPKLNTPAPTIPSDEAPTREHQVVHAGVNVEAVRPLGGHEAAGPASGPGDSDSNDPAEQALDEFFDDADFDPEFGDDRRFGGRLRRKR